MSRRALIGFIIAAIATVALLVVYFLDQRIPRDPSDVGNSAGNLHNGGYFFEMDGKVYFANPADSYCLYSMNTDETKPKRLTSMGVKYISGANGYLYFYMDSTHKATSVKGLGSATNQYGIYRCRTDGRDQVCLLRDFCGECQLCGEYVYYQVKTDGGSLNRIRVDKQDKSKIADEKISPVCYDDGVIYYTGVSSDHNIHALNTKASNSTYDVLYGNYFFPVVNGYYIYYLNGDSNYSLWRTNLVNGGTEIVTTERLDCYTMDNNYIYYCYSNGLLSQLKRCNLDGSNQIVLFQGVVNDLNLTSKYLYFKVYGNDTVLYHIPLDGSAQASVVEIKLEK
jgi:hypothetical protein